MLLPMVFRPVFSRVGKYFRQLTVSLGLTGLRTFSRHNTQGLVSGVGNACFQKYPSEALARAAYMEAWTNGQVQNLS